MNAVEEALRLKEAQGGEVVVVSLGPREGASSRCARRSRWAPTAPCSSPTTPRPAPTSSRRATRSRAALEREAADLVLFGQQSSDGDGAVLWAAVADRLRRPLVSQVAELTVDGGSVTGKRQTEYGYDVIRAPLPAVVAVSDAINEPRYPSLKGIMGAKTKPQETLSLADLGVDAGPCRRGRARGRPSLAPRRPPPKSGQVQIEDDGTRRREDRRVPRREEADLMARRSSSSSTTTASSTKGGLGVLAKAASLGGDVAGVVLGHGVADVAAHGRRASAHSTVYVVDDPALAAPLPQPRVDALAARRRGRRAPTRCSSPRRCSPPTSPPGSRRGSTPGSTGTSPTSRVEGGELVGKRPALGDTVLVEVGWTSTPAPRARPLRHVRPGRVRRRGRGRAVDVAFRDFSTQAMLVEQAQEAASGPSIEDADVIVAGGRGLGAPEGFALCEELAAALGGAVAATRAVVDAGWYPYSTQVGQTGKTRLAEALHRAAASRARSSTRSGCRARGRSSRSTRIRTRRSSTSPTSASSATCTRSSPKLTELVRARKARMTRRGAPVDFPPPVRERRGRRRRRPTAPDERIEVGDR